MQHGPRRKIIEAFRGVGKSYITVAFVLWTLLLNPLAKILVVSAGEKLAGDFTQLCLRLISEMPILQHLRPSSDLRKSMMAFDVGPAAASKDPSVKSVGITGQLTGGRADLIVADDIETPKNSQTFLLRERLSELVKEFDAVLKPEGKVVYLGTPQTETSLYTKLWKDRGYDVRIWPAEVPAEPSRYSGKLGPYISSLLTKGVKPGTPVEPTRFPESELMERKASYGLAGYALQYMLDTSPSDIDRFPLKLHDLIIHDCDPEMAHVKMVWGNSREDTIQDLDAGGLDGDCYFRASWRSPEMAKYTQTVLAIDPSGSGKDETAYAIVKYAFGQLYLMDSGGFVDGFGEKTLETIAGKAAHHRVNDVIIEKNYGGGMFDQLLRPYLAKLWKTGDGTERRGGTIDEEWNGWSKGQKELRILDTLEPLFQNHRLVIDRKVIEADLKQQHENSRYSLVQQLTRISRIKGALANDDRLEALSMACGYFVEKMARDKDRVLDQHKQSLMQAELRKYMDHVMGRKKPTQLRWA